MAAKWSAAKIAGVKQGGAAGSKVPPSIVTNINVESGNYVVKLSWTDPNDIIVEDVNVNEWAGTVIVLNEDHIPQNQNDGTKMYTSTERNKHKDRPYYFEDLYINRTYYYGIFPFSKSKVYNVNPSQTGKFTVTSAPPLKPLASYTWLEINQIANMGYKSEDGNHWMINDTVYFTIGDKTSLVNFGDEGMHEFILEDFLHDDLADGSGKASFSFIADTGLKNSRCWTNNITLSGSIPDTELYNQLQNEIFDKIVEGPKSYIKEIKKKCCASYGSTEVISYNAKLWIPTEIEMFGDNTNSTVGEGEHYPRYTSDESRIKKVNGSAEWYLLSSMYQTNKSVRAPGINMCSVYTNGSIQLDAIISGHSVVLGFCIGNGGVK